MAVEQLKPQIARLPEQPGVYIFVGAAGETLYVGKARVLRDRVRSYLSARGASPRIDGLLDEAQDLEIIVTDSVVEALALETHLIKQRQPKYNVLLRDDKNYPYLVLTTGEAYPRVLVARRVERDGHVYAGPFLPASLARRTMSLTHRLFGIRSCNEVITGARARPCLEYDIKRCLAPCVASICTREQYAAAVHDARLFLDGKSDELVAALRARMEEASATEAFERAAELRDAIRTIETLRVREQKMAEPGLADRDAFGVKTGPSGASVQVFQVRGGRVIERVELVWEGERDGATVPTAEAEVLQAALQQVYEERIPPREVHVPIELDDRADLEAWLSQRAGRSVRVLVPRRGTRRALIELATRNAALGYERRFNQTPAAHYAALETLQAALSLPILPRRIEAFDVSTIQGRETVAALVVCEDGRMKRSDYRTFRIRGTAGQGVRAEPRESQAWEPRHVAAPRGADDVAAIREVVLRRYRRVLEHGGPYPDLVLIDGGQGQLAAAYRALEALGLANLVAVGLAKKQELLFTRDRTDPLALDPDSPALLLLRRIRDEAHRVAVTFHRRARRMRDLQSELDHVPGIGRTRRRALLSAFHGVAGVRRATRAELAAVVGPKAADALLTYFAAR